MSARETGTGEAVFRLVSILSATLGVLALAAVPFREPGTRSRVVSILALGLQTVLIGVAAAGLYFGWQPLRGFD